MSGRGMDTVEVRKAGYQMPNTWSEQLWRELVDAAPDSLVMVDRSGLIVYGNYQTEMLFGYTRDELLGQSVEILLPERYRKKHVGQRNAFLGSPHVRPMGQGRELFALHKDGTEIPVEISLSPLTKSADYVTAAIRDISERKRFQEELKRARQVAEEANRSKSEFLANMSHEIRTPLAGIVGYAELMGLYCHTEEERNECIRAIHRCSDSLTSLINDILDLSKVEAGALEVECLPLAVVSEVESVLDLLQKRAAEKNISLKASYDRPLPSIFYSDPNRVRQILVNLLGNGVKFTDAGGVAIRVYSDHDNIHFAITDTGCGLTIQEQGRLFQSFVQADSSTTRKYGGTGLGLALSRRLARALGGDVTISASEPGVGSTFQLSLPVGKPQDESTPVIRQKPIEICGDVIRLDGLRILFAEDNPDNRDLVTRFLSESGAMVDTALNGKEACERMKEKKYSAIVMDMQMPVLDGYEATRKLRREGHLLPIIALTAHAMNEERKKCLESGCDVFLTKPVNTKRLVHEIYRLTHQLVMSDSESEPSVK
jgi:PAS domain S-box-containing protein